MKTINVTIVQVELIAHMVSAYTPTAKNRYLPQGVNFTLAHIIPVLSGDRVSQSLFKSGWMSGFEYIFIYRKILVTARPILFSFTVKLLIGSGKVFNHFGTLNLLRDIDFKKYFRCRHQLENRVVRMTYMCVFLCFFVSLSKSQKNFLIIYTRLSKYIKRRFDFSKIFDTL